MGGEEEGSGNTCDTICDTCDMGEVGDICDMCDMGDVSDTCDACVIGSGVVMAAIPAGGLVVGMTNVVVFGGGSCTSCCCLVII
jgi:hypothetical protein